MAINLKFDLMGNPEPPSIVLANRNGNKLGQLDVDAKSIDIKDSMKTSEFTFTLNKYVNGKLTNLWDKVVDFKLVYCPEWDLWYGIKVELDEATETIKTIFCTQLGQEELSQIMVYNTEINTEADIARDDYKISILYDEDNKDASIFHRVMSKAPHYSIAYIDESLKRIQRAFSFDDSSICDVFDEIEEEVGCLVIYNSNSDKNGMPKRDVSVYDLYQHCNDCGYREEFIGDECPKCHSKNIIDGYGEDTTIFVTSDELATEGIQLVTDTDSVKNCFKLEAGDDLMTATIRNCNPNGSDYIWYFSDAVKEDMSKELVNKIESYDELYKDYYDNYQSALNENSVNDYNALVNKYKEYYNTDSVCINCDYEGEFENECPSCHSGNILVGKRLQTIDTPITGYSALMNAYYNTIDLALYLKSGLMPNVEMSDTSAEEQVALLTSSALSPVAVENISSASRSTVNSVVLSMAKVLIRPTYKVEIENPDTTNFVDNGDSTKTWTGKFIVTNYSDDTDMATSDFISVIVNGDKETFIKQKIDKALNKENTDDYSISGLFEKEYEEFCNELKKYALNPLTNFYESCEACISILMAQGVGDDTTSDLYESLYTPYYNKLAAIESEIQLRESEINLIVGVYDDDGDLITQGLQSDIEDCKSQIQEALNFETYLGEDLWLEFCAYRREDKYSNSNYVSDGLNNAELFEKANEFIEVAENEIFKSAELQHSISATLNNLLSLPKFKPLVKHFQTGNWIRVQVDDRIFKLRLLEYNFNYGDLESIPVEFSDVTKIKNGTTDVQDVFAQAASMASSYDFVQRQAKKGDVARTTIDQWLIDGLNAANVQIQSNDSEEVLLTKNGLLARSYSDITGTYSPEQLKITHNIMAYTDDNWKTVSSALGKHEYQKWKDNRWVTDTDYGLSSKFVTAGYVTGSQIVGGEIVSSNYKLGEEQKGTYINLIEGDFEFAGGKIVYDSQKNKVTLSGVTIQWDNVNKPTIENIDGLSGITDDIRAIEQGLQATTINDQYVISPNIVGGYLNIKNDNNVGVVIDPNEDYIFQVYNSNGATTIGAKSNGDTVFTGTINGSHFVGGDLLIGDETKVGNYAEIANDGTLTCTNVNIQGGILQMGSKNDKETHTWITSDGTLNTYNANINGTIRAASGSIGGFTIEPITDENSDTIGGWLYGGKPQEGQTSVQIGNNDSIFLSPINMSGTINSYTKEDWRLTVGNNFGVISNGTVYSSNAVLTDCTIAGGSFKMGTHEDGIDGYSVWISAEEGILNAYGANINGTITAIDGEIGGWKINTDGIYSEVMGVVTGISSTTPIEKFTDGLEFELGDTSYNVTKYNGTDTDINIPSVYNKRTVNYIKHEAFLDCDGITSVTMPNSITGIGSYAFSGCYNLQNINISNNIQGIDEGAFFQCESLKNIEIPNSATRIGFGIFVECSGLESITIPFVGVNGINSGSGHFGYIFGADSSDLNSECVPSSLKSVIITNPRVIHDYAFLNCANLTSVTIGDSIQIIGDYAFYGCDGLEEICYCGNETQWNQITIGTNAIPSGVSIVYNATYSSQGDDSTISDSSSQHFSSLVDKNKVSYPRFFAGYTLNNNSYIPQPEDDVKYLVLEDGSLYASAANISGTINATSGKFNNGNFNNCTIENTCTIKGSLSGATGDFSGIIKADEGNIGDWNIQDGYLESSTSYIQNDNTRYQTTRLTAMGVDVWYASNKSDINLKNKPNYSLNWADIAMAIDRVLDNWDLMG